MPVSVASTIFTFRRDAGDQLILTALLIENGHSLAMASGSTRGREDPSFSAGRILETQTGVMATVFDRAGIIPKGRSDVEFVYAAFWRVFDLAERVRRNENAVMADVTRQSVRERSSLRSGPFPVALDWLRNLIERRPPQNMLPYLFTQAELRNVYQAIFGGPINTAAFDNVFHDNLEGETTSQAAFDPPIKHHGDGRYFFGGRTKYTMPFIAEHLLVSEIAKNSPALDGS